MTIDHIAMYVNDLDAAKDFFVNYIGGCSGELYHNNTTGFSSYFISFDSGARLEIMSRPNAAELQKDIYRTGYSHIAFSVGSKEGVDQLTDKLRSAGFKILSGPRSTGDGYYESCILAIEDNIIEITV